MKHFILGGEAGDPAAPSIFYDASSDLKVVTRDKNNPVEYKGPITKKISIAVKNGHIVEVDAPKKSKEASKGSKDTTKGKGSLKDAVKELADMDSAELLAYYKDNYEVTENDEAEFVALPLDEQRAFLKED